MLFSHPVMSDSLQPHGLQHTRPLCPSPFPEVCPSSCPLHQWCHPVISSSDALFSCPQPFLASRTFPKSPLFASDDQNTGASASISVLPMNIQCWFPLRLTGLISFLSKGLSGVFSSTTVWRYQFFGILLLYGPAFTTVHDHWDNHSLDYMGLVGRVMSLLFSTLSLLVIAFLLRINCLLLSWLQSSSAVILEPKKRKSVTISTFSPYLPWSNGVGCHDFSFWVF